MKQAATHTEHKAFPKPFVSVLNLPIVPPRQRADKAWMDLLRALKVEPVPCFFFLLSHRKGRADEQSAACVFITERALLLIETAHYLMSNRMKTAPVQSNPVSRRDSSRPLEIRL